VAELEAVMTRDFFKGQMARLAGLKFVPVDLTTHWEALHDMPDVVLEAAIARSQRTRVEFPTPAEIRVDADIVARHVTPVGPDEDRGADLDSPVTIGHLPNGAPIVQTRTWKYYCDICEDGGMRSWWCGAEPSKRYPWLSLRHCHNPKCRMTNYAHDWSERCSCWDTNPKLVKEREKAKKYAEQAAADKKTRAH
jgi:hypothetical protein